MNTFQNLHAVVTGGTGALGTAVVNALLKEGAHIHIPVFHIHELQACPFHNNKSIRLVPGIDVRSESSAEGFYRDIPALFTSIHVAGGFDMGPIAEMTQPRYEELMSINAQTAFFSCREAVKRIRATGGKTAPKGTIVNVAARPAAIATLGANMVAYTMSKSAVAALTQSLAEELRAEGIWVNAVLPSILDTPANRKSMPDADYSTWPKVDQVAAAILRLASP
ncbi:MAG TPA: SDR family NAD(P)-dependent oxidoreductase, partial [Phycisphaerales bacterium]|nr:SDR family NAD(P)-dependent oxidoreductase [Phycisphaerales bacterium]